MKKVKSQTKSSTSNYVRFFLMLLFSGLSMYVTMYFNTYKISHIYFSWTRFYMTLIGIGGMALVMFFFMRQMYSDRLKNVLIVVGSILLMTISTVLVRTQTPIEDVKWMKAMIPHHSIAILTSSQTKFSDPEVQKLANEIIEAQEREIAKMKEMIKRFEQE